MLTKHVVQFSARSRSPDGYSSWCRECHAKYNREWYLKNREVQLERAKVRHSRNLEARRLISRRSRLKAYGITVDDYRALLHAQDSKCAVCGAEEAVVPKGMLYVDHDHVTGKVRGLLCNNCNTLLGMAGDNITVLQKAMEYLR